MYGQAFVAVQILLKAVFLEPGHFFLFLFNTGEKNLRISVILYCSSYKNQSVQIQPVGKRITTCWMLKRLFTGSLKSVSARLFFLLIFNFSFGGGRDLPASSCFVFLVRVYTCVNMIFLMEDLLSLGILFLVRVSYFNWEVWSWTSCFSVCKA